MTIIEQLQKYFERTAELIDKYSGDRDIQQAFYDQAFGAADFASRVLWEQYGNEKSEEVCELWNEWSVKLNKIMRG